MTFDQFASNQFEIHSNSVRYVAPDGTVLAEVTFPAAGDGLVEIDHTFVDESLRGHGVAGLLLEHAARELSETHRKVRPTCSYAVMWFEKHPEWSGLLAA